MFPQPIPGSRERQSASRSAPRGILGGDVAGLGSLGGFPEPGTPGGELGLAGARARDQGRAWGGLAGVGMVEVDVVCSCFLNFFSLPLFPFCFLKLYVTSLLPSLPYN